MSKVLAVSLGMLGVWILQGALLVEARLGPATTSDSDTNSNNKQERKQPPLFVRRLQGFEGEKDAEEHLPLPLCSGGCGKNKDVSYNSRICSCWWCIHGDFASNNPSLCF